MSPTQRRTILVVDDEPSIRKLVTVMLEEKGYGVLAAGNGENAVRLCRENPAIDLLLTDVVAPGMSGPAIADQVAALNPAVKVLFMTGYDGTYLVQHYAVAKGYSLLAKPFTMGQLEHKIESVLAGVAAESGN